MGLSLDWKVIFVRSEVFSFMDTSCSAGTVDEHQLPSEYWLQTSNDYAVSYRHQRKWEKIAFVSESLVIDTMASSFDHITRKLLKKQDIL